MKLNRDNYELYFADYLEGLLKPEGVDELMVFLKNNPDLEDEFYSFKNISIPENENVFFENKNNLKKSTSDKKTITENNIDEFLIAYIENDLPAKDIIRLELFLKDNPKYQSDLEIFKKTISIPDLNVTFNAKKSLKKKTAAKEVSIKYFYYSVAAAAACILLFFNVFFSDISPINDREGLRLAQKDLFLEAGMSHVLFSDSQNNDTDNNTVNNIVNNNQIQNSDHSANKSQLFEKISQRNSNFLLASNISPVVNSEKREEYSSIYNYVKTSEYKIETEDYSDIVPEKTRDSFIKYAANKILYNSKKDKAAENDKKMGVWDIVDLGTYGINSLAKNNLIEVNRTKENNVVKTDFALGGNVVYSRSSTDK